MPLHWSWISTVRTSSLVQKINSVAVDPLTCIVTYCNVRPLNCTYSWYRLVGHMLQYVASFPGPTSQTIGKAGGGPGTFWHVTDVKLR